MSQAWYCCGCNVKLELEERVCPLCGQAPEVLPADSTHDVVLDVLGRESSLPGVVPGDLDGYGLVGETFAHYRIEEFIGKGGMARVYRAHHTTLMRKCAIKILSPRMVARDPRFVELFFSEARSAAALVHPHVVTVHNIGVHDNFHFIEMEFVDGCSMGQLVQEGGAQDVALGTHLILQTCRGLAAAHDRGVIHRDVKPANILLTREQNAKLADFGLAKRIYSGRTSRIVEKSLTGTPHFMAPELFRGKSAHPRSDVYALGVTYFNVLAGRLPFLRETISELIHNHEVAAVPSPRQDIDVPDEVTKVLETSMAKRDEDRYPNAHVFAEALEVVLAQLRDLDHFVRDALEEVTTECVGESGCYQATVKLQHGRSQRVFVETSQAGPSADRLMRIYSVCAPLSEGYYRRALELNANMPYGSIAIQSIDGRPHFIMVDTHPQWTCGAEQLRRSVLAIARWSDDVEKVLTSTDRF